MRVFMYIYRPGDDVIAKKCAEKLGLDVTLCYDKMNLESIEKAKGHECVCMAYGKVERDLLTKMAEIGVQYIATRSIGVDHIDMEAAKELGIHVANTHYPPDSVADYAVMHILMASRITADVLRNSLNADYSGADARLVGNALSDLTIGVAGTGKIGASVVRRLVGFDCKILANDLYPSDEVKKYAEYVSFDELIARSDILTLHMPATTDNYHIINRETISKMKDGAIIVNTARGTLIDTDALIEGLQSGKLGGAGLDVWEGEGRFADDANKILAKMKTLQAMDNVLLTPHNAYYSKQVLRAQIELSLEGCAHYIKGENNPYQLL